jgi:hypothetical protein
MNRDLRALIGASVLSSAGSLPLHLAPLIVAVVVTDGRMSVANAGWVATAVLLGTLATAILLPLLDVRLITRPFATILASTLLFGLLLSSFAGLLLVGWFIVGICCGGFQYLGTSTAATHSQPAFAFPIRLGTVLCIAGLTVAAVRSIETGSYLVMLFVLAAVLGLITASGIVLYGPLKSRAPAVDRDPASPLKYLALAIVFVLFVGQTGLLAYVVQQAGARGIGLGGAFWALAMMKVGAGLCLLLLARSGLQNRQNPRFIELGILLAGGNFIVATTTSLPLFFAGLLGLELGFNLLSARLQAMAADIAPSFAGKWLVATILLGAAAGPALHGLALRLDANAAFIVFAMVSALVPVILLGRSYFRLHLN